MNAEKSMPLIFDIHHFSLDDGPGIRTTVFLKGCPLSCVWCHNPESISCSMEIAFHPEKCIACGDCLEHCRYNAVRMDEGRRILRDNCTRCGDCVEICPATALRAVGTYYPVAGLAEILVRDTLFYESSRGGVTFSGGEPTLHAGYLEAVMKELKRHNIHVALQTSGMFDRKEFSSRLLPYLDLIYYDIKLYDAEHHRQYTGRTNERILENFAHLVQMPDIKIIPRVPLVPGITDTEENLTQIASFLKSVGWTRCHFLPYNPGGIAKRRAIGRPVPAILSDRMMGMEEEKKRRAFFQKQGCSLPAGKHSSELL